MWKPIKSDYIMLSISWALTKGDWWKDKSEETAKFLSFRWNRRYGDYIITGIYIGRLAIVLQTKSVEDDK
jgi:hypothetical protein